MRRITAKSIPRLLKQKKPGIPRELEALCLSLEHWKENALAAKCNKDIWGFILGDTCACCFQANTEGFTFGNDCPNDWPSTKNAVVAVGKPFYGKSF